jgi:glycerophosphoryl diester phosphodiesterase
MLRAHPALSYYREELLTQSRRPAPELISHRGSHASLPENSIPAFLQAIELGAEAIELDVHATKDGEVVVHHDPTVEARGSPAAEIVQLTFAELKRYPLAPDVSIPALSAVLAAIGQRAAVYVEIKARDIEPLVVRCIRQSEARCAVHSFDHRTIKTVKAIFPAIATGVLEVARHLDPADSLIATGSRDLWQEVDYIDEELVLRAHAVNARVIAWTANDPAQWEIIRAIGVDGICTDRIAELATFEW